MPFLVELALEVRYISNIPNVTSGQAAAERRLVFEHIKENFPEYQHAFDLVFVGSVGVDGTGFREAFQWDE